MLKPAFTGKAAVMFMTSTKLSVNMAALCSWNSNVAGNVDGWGKNI
jgi:hypothetical protein